MKKMIILSALLAVMLGTAGCSSDNDRDINYAGAETITLSQTVINVDNSAQAITVDLKASHEFEAYTDKSWLSVTPANSAAKETTLTITVEANTDTVARAGKVGIWAGGSRQYVTVTQAKGSAAIVAPAGYRLVWNDEFDGDELSSDWTYEIQGAGWVNNELQNYVNDGVVTRVSDGSLKINLYRFENEIRSARIYAKRTTGWQYGYFEARIQLPKGKGTWPAFWMMPVNFTSWPADGEIDIMEEVGNNPNVVVSTIHCNKYNNTGTAIESASRNIGSAESQYHVYACEWTAEKLVFFVDGEELLTYRNDGTGRDAWPFDQPFYMILNVAFGGDWGGAAGVDKDGTFPTSMMVDYVRVFQK